MGKFVKLAALAAMAAGAARWYRNSGRDRCLTWGATEAEAVADLPGDDVLPDAEEVSTRAISIDAPPADVWPWIVQMGSGRGGVYTYDWIENLFGLQMHSVDQILPQFQHIEVGDEIPAASGQAGFRVEVVEPERTIAFKSMTADWVWIFALRPDGDHTRLISRNRMNNPAKSAVGKVAYLTVMEPGSLVMERKMLLGIKERAERLATEHELARS